MFHTCTDKGDPLASHNNTTVLQSLQLDLDYQFSLDILYPKTILAFSQLESYIPKHIIPFWCRCKILSKDINILGLINRDRHEATKDIMVRIYLGSQNEAKISRKVTRILLTSHTLFTHGEYSVFLTFYRTYEIALKGISAIWSLLPWTSMLL